MGRFGLTPLEASRMTDYDFYMYTLAHQIKMQENVFIGAQQAWLNQQAKATKKVGKTMKSVYKNFEEFYNFEKEFKSVFVPLIKHSTKMSMAEMNRKLNRKGG